MTLTHEYHIRSSNILIGSGFKVHVLKDRGPHPDPSPSLRLHLA